MAITGYPNLAGLPPNLQVQFKLVWDALIGLDIPSTTDVSDALAQLASLADSVSTLQQFQQQLLQFRTDMLGRMINTTIPLRGGGSLSADLTLDLAIRAARVQRTTNQTLTTAVFTPVSFDAERWDYGNFWAVGQPTKLVAPVAGWYHIGGSVSFTANATGTRIVAIRLNGAGNGYGRIQDTPNQAGSVVTWPVSCDLKLAALDYVELMAQQSSGGDLDILPTQSFGSEFWMHLVATGV